VSDSVLALGVRWHEQGKRKVIWLGTGFVMQQPRQGVTAGHVLKAMVEQSNNLQHRELAPVMVAKTADGQIGELGRPQVHPAILDRSETAKKPAPSDVAVFKIESQLQASGLPLADQVPAVGRAVAVGGFPRGLSTIDYGIKPGKGKPIRPTIKFGSIERHMPIVNSREKRQAVLQHGLALGSGFSGSPMVNREGEVVGLVTTSTHVHAEEMVRTEAAQPSGRWLNPADVNFAVPATRVRAWLNDGG
jgi:S1-C subfamily serine protease